ncbi:MAG: Gfo/Idh/MocA family oxidoreductase, partial [Pirellulaceae bacterium]
MTRQNQFNRRQFVKTTALGAAALSAGVHSGIAAEEDKSANGKLQIGCIGTANRAAADVAGVKGEDIVALCDIDKKYLDRAQKQFPSARVYADYRELIAAESDKIDAVTVAVADHNHAP